MKKVIVIILCIALVVCAGIYVKHALGKIHGESSARELELEKLKQKNESTLPVIRMEGSLSKKQLTAHYMVLITDSYELIGDKISQLCDFYGIAYTADMESFDPETRVYGGYTVYGSYELDVKSNIMSAIENGEDFCIGIGLNDQRDTFSEANIEAMCRFLADYIDSGSLAVLEM